MLAACDEPGSSVAGVAQRYQVNANLVHKWRKAAGERDPSADNEAGFLPLATPTPAAPDVRITLIIGGVTIHWPISHIQQAVPWLKALQS